MAHSLCVGPASHTSSIAYIDVPIRRSGSRHCLALLCARACAIRMCDIFGTRIEGCADVHIRHVPSHICASMTTSMHTRTYTFVPPTQVSARAPAWATDARIEWLFNYMFKSRWFDVGVVERVRSARRVGPMSCGGCVGAISRCPKGQLACPFRASPPPPPHTHTRPATTTHPPHRPPTLASLP